MREHQERVIEMQTLTGQGQGHTIRREETEEEEIGATVVASQASQEKEEDMKRETGEEDSTRTREEEIEEEEIFQETEDHLRLGGHSQEEERVREDPVATEREEAGLTPSRSEGGYSRDRNFRERSFSRDRGNYQARDSRSNFRERSTSGGFNRNRSFSRPRSMERRTRYGERSRERYSRSPSQTREKTCIRCSSAGHLGADCHRYRRRSEYPCRLCKEKRNLLLFHPERYCLFETSSSYRSPTPETREARISYLKKKGSYKAVVKN